jgi:uncharacterized protein YqjF (DUF2071 family)
MDILNIIRDTAHRPFELPTGAWQYYQEWNDALFLHWTIPCDVIRSCIPRALNLDTFNGDAYVSLVAFTMQKIRPRVLPAIGYVSDFDEINLRTYINNDGKSGVYFLSIEAGKRLSVLIARALSGLPYVTACIARSKGKYSSINDRTGCYMDAAFEVGQQQEKTNLDKWLTERYCLYLDDGGKLFRYDIHHKEWKINHVRIDRLSLNYGVGGVSLSNIAPGLTHYSEGVKVVAWGRQRIS